MRSAGGPILLAIAGLDPSAGAGILADVKTAAALGCYGVACPTALTVQNTAGVLRWQAVERAIVRESLEALAAESRGMSAGHGMCDTGERAAAAAGRVVGAGGGLAAVKVGMLGPAAVAGEVVEFLGRMRSEVPIVVDPVLRSSSGTELLDGAALPILRERLLPRATVVTPNVPEAEALAEMEVRSVADQVRAAERLRRMGAKAVVVKGGHLAGAEAVDVLAWEGESIEFRAPRMKIGPVHGTGCAFSTALACGLAKGESLPEAVRSAKRYVAEAMRAAAPRRKGAAVLEHFWRFRSE